MGRQNPERERRTYRLSLVDNDTHDTLRSVRFTKLGFIYGAITAVLALLLVFYLLFAFTPLRTIIPGYPNPHSRKEAVANAIKIDSLENVITRWNLYAANLSRVLTGEATVDFDSLVRSATPRYLSDKDAAELARRDSVLRETVQKEEQFGVGSPERALPIEGMHFFSPLKGVNDLEPVQRRVLFLAENGIALICMHTNLDIARGGVNDVLIRLLGAEPEGALDADGCGRVGSFAQPMPLESFLDHCKARLGVPAIRYCRGGKPVSKLAVMGGAGAGSLEEAVRLGCDTYVTADVKYHQFQRAEELGLNLLDADHFYTENPVMQALADQLAERFPAVEFKISRRHTDCIHFA